MTEVVTFRPRRPKRELQETFANLSEKLNDLIERELQSQPRGDWRSILDRDRPAISDADYKSCLQPE
jgi:hypothetical protein